MPLILLRLDPLILRCLPARIRAIRGSRIASGERLTALPAGVRLDGPQRPERRAWGDGHNGCLAVAVECGSIKTPSCLWHRKQPSLAVGKALRKLMNLTLATGLAGVNLFRTKLFSNRFHIPLSVAVTALPFGRAKVPLFLFARPQEARRLKGRLVRVGIATDPNPGAADFQADAVQTDDRIDRRIQRIAIVSILAGLDVDRLAFAPLPALQESPGRINRLHHFQAARIPVRVILHRCPPIGVLTHFQGNPVAGQAQDVERVLQFHWILQGKARLAAGFNWVI